ncbi:MAG: hypothetical protein AAB372_03410 [Patescibacteria group bacterium]
MIDNQHYTGAPAFNAEVKKLEEALKKREVEIWNKALLYISLLFLVPCGLVLCALIASPTILTAWLAWTDGASTIPLWLWAIAFADSIFVGGVTHQIFFRRGYTIAELSGQGA